MAIRLVDYLVTDYRSWCLPDLLYDKFYKVINKNLVFKCIGCSTESKLSIFTTKVFRYTIILCCSWRQIWQHLKV